ncbi:MAG: hypothetical protein VW405_05075 [Rhodospirillaceae bacterium]
MAFPSPMTPQRRRQPPIFRQSAWTRAALDQFSVQLGFMCEPVGFAMGKRFATPLRHERRRRDFGGETMESFARVRRSAALGTASAALFAAAIAFAASTHADQGTIALCGKLYDKWFKLTKAPTPKDTHKAWPASNTKKKGNVTHRCKSCHGWDLMGKDGAYGSGWYKNGIGGVRNHAGGDPAKVVAAMTNDTHGFAGKMDGAAMNAIAMFVTQGQVDMDSYIDRKSTAAKGDPAKGKDYYATLCTGCHGADGKLPKDLEKPLGALSSGNPWEILHKIMNGQLGEEIPALRALPMQVSVDVLAYL